MPISTLISFVDSLEMGYSKHKNPYHNVMHAADVTQTVHYMLLKTGMMVSLVLGYVDAKYILEKIFFRSEFLSKYYNVSINFREF